MPPRSTTPMGWQPPWGGIEGRIRGLEKQIRKQKEELKKGGKGFGRTMSDMPLSLQNLRTCLHHVSKMLQDRGIEEVTNGADDFYWTVDSDTRCDVSQDPEINVGSLIDDIAELQKLLAEPSRASVVDLERLASVLRYLADSSLASWEDES